MIRSNRMGVEIMCFETSTQDYTDLPPGLPKLLEMFSCDCKTGCSSLKCTCPNELVCISGNCDGLIAIQTQKLLKCMMVTVMSRL